MRSDIIAVRHLPPAAGRCGRAFVTSDGIGGTAPSEDDRAGVVVPRYGRGADGSGMVSSSSCHYGPVAASRAVAAAARPASWPGSSGQIPAESAEARHYEL